jgi:uncharacterized protein (UPF0332 family)
MDEEFGAMLSVALRHRMTSTYSPEAVVTLDRAESTVADARRFLDEVGSILNY